jgi:hypothetical protein
MELCRTYHIHSIFNFEKYMQALGDLREPLFRHQQFLGKASLAVVGLDAKLQEVCHFF